MCLHRLKDPFLVQDIKVGLCASNKIVFSLGVESLFSKLPLIETITFLLKPETDNTMNLVISGERLQKRPSFSVCSQCPGIIQRITKDGGHMESPEGSALTGFLVTEIEA